MGHQRKHVLWLLGIGLTCSVVQPAWAQDPLPKAGRGAVNVLTSWIELPKQMHLGRQEEHPIIGIGQGLFRGTSLALLRIGVGLYEALTFPIPYPRGFASPYLSLQLPDYAWQVTRGTSYEERTAPSTEASR